MILKFPKESELDADESDLMKIREKQATCWLDLPDNESTNERANERTNEQTKKRYH